MKRWSLMPLVAKRVINSSKLLRLTAIYYYDQKGGLYRIERKIWGKSLSDLGLLIGKTVEGGNGQVYLIERLPMMRD